MLYHGSFYSQTRFYDNSDGYDLPNLTFAANVPLPSVDEVYTTAFGMAWPQVLAFSAACLSIISVTLIIKALAR